MKELKCKQCEAELKVTKMPVPAPQQKIKTVGKNINIKIELQETDIFKIILNLISKISKDKRIDEALRAEYIEEINSIINSDV